MTNKMQFVYLLTFLMLFSACQEQEKDVSPEFENIRQSFFEELENREGFQFEVTIENRTFKGTDGELVPELDILNFAYHCTDFEQKEDHVTFSCKSQFLRYLSEDVRYDSERPISAPPAGLAAFHEREVQLWFFPDKTEFRYAFNPETRQEETNHRFLEETFQKIKLPYFLKTLDITSDVEYEMLTFFPHHAQYSQTQKGKRGNFKYYQGIIESKTHEESVSYYDYDADFKVAASSGYFNFVRHQEDGLTAAFNSVRLIEGKFSYQNRKHPTDFLEGEMNNSEKVKVIFRPLEK